MKTAAYFQDVNCISMVCEEGAMNRNTFRSRSMLALPGVGFHMLCVAALGLMLSSGLRADSSQSTPTIVAQLGLVSPIGVAVDGSGTCMWPITPASRF